MRLFQPKVPHLLIGTKSDARLNPELQSQTVTHQEGDKMAKKIGSPYPYLEVSVNDKTGITELQAIIKEFVRASRKKTTKGTCNVQ
jgi:hypothetical protein